MLGGGGRTMTHTPDRSFSVTSGGAAMVVWHFEIRRECFPALRWYIRVLCLNKG